MVIGPRYASRRSVSAQALPAAPAPMITTDFGPVTGKGSKSTRSLARDALTRWGSPFSCPGSRFRVTRTTLFSMATSYDGRSLSAGARDAAPLWSSKQA